MNAGFGFEDAFFVSKVRSLANPGSKKANDKTLFQAKHGIQKSAYGIPSSSNLSQSSSQTAAPSGFPGCQPCNLFDSYTATLKLEIQKSAFTYSNLLQ